MTTDERSAARRDAMVRSQIERRGVTHPGVLAALRAVPRELFVPPHLAETAYEDRALPIGSDQTISQPYMVAVMTQALNLTPSSRVLEIGTGSGYQAAVLSQLAARGDHDRAATRARRASPRPACDAGLRQRAR